MKALAVISLFVVLVTTAFPQSQFGVNHYNVFTNESVVDKAINLTIDSSVWRPLTWRDERTGGWFYTDSLFTFTRARQTNDSIIFYVCVDLLPYADTTGVFKGHQSGLPWFRYTIDSIKSASTYTNVNQFQQWKIAKLQVGAPALQALTGIAGFRWFRIVTTCTRAPQTAILAGNSTCASGGALQPRYWINAALLGRGGK